MGKSFRDLVVWQRAIDLTTCIYQLSATFPSAEMYGLTSQLRRAAVSVASNIAEGAGRGAGREADAKGLVTASKLAVPESFNDPVPVTVAMQPAGSELRSSAQMGIVKSDTVLRTASRREIP